MSTDNQTKVNLQIEQAKNQLRDRAKDTIDSIYDSIISTTVNNKIPEDIFKNHFLPYLTRQKVPESGISVIAQWVGVAGTPGSEVDVIDNSGKVLYTVPSLVDTSMIVDLEKGNSIKNIVIMAEQLKSGIPIVAENYLRNEFTSKVHDLATLNNNASTVKRWTDIVNRYNNQSKLNSKESDNDDNDLFE